MGKRILALLQSNETRVVRNHSFVMVPQVQKITFPIGGVLQSLVSDDISS